MRDESFKRPTLLAWFHMSICCMQRYRSILKEISLFCKCQSSGSNARARLSSIHNVLFI